MNETTRPAAAIGASGGFHRACQHVVSVSRFALGVCLVLAWMLAPAGWAADRSPSGRQHAGAVDLQDLSHLLRTMGTLAEGRKVFRFDTFGDEVFWGDGLRLHEAIAGAEHGGVGDGVSPRTALQLGLKVDSSALPARLKRDLIRGRLDLDDPATTLALLKLNAVVGVVGFFEHDTLTSVGITCALCHSTVDDALAPGIGRRLDGWAAGDLDVGAIIAASPDLQPLVDRLSLALPGVTQSTVVDVLNGWGPGRFDASLLIDGKAARPDGRSAATLIPSIFGLAGVNLHTWTGWGSVTHWNAFVANLEMGGQGVFVDARLQDAAKFPIAAAAGLHDVRHDPDLVTAKLPALHLYQLSLEPPGPAEGAFDQLAARRGEKLFNGEAGCARCHVPPLYTEPGWNMHTAEEIGIDTFQSDRSPDERYRTAPLRGIWTRGERGFYHDGRFATLDEVVEHYDDHLSLGLGERDRADLVSFLRSL